MKLLAISSVIIFLMSSWATFEMLVVRYENKKKYPLFLTIVLSAIAFVVTFDLLSKFIAMALEVYQRVDAFAMKQVLLSYLGSLIRYILVNFIIKFRIEKSDIEKLYERHFLLLHYTSVLQVLMVFILCFTWVICFLGSPFLM